MPTLGWRLDGQPAAEILRLEWFGTLSLRTKNRAWHNSNDQKGGAWADLARIVIHIDRNRKSRDQNCQHCTRKTSSRARSRTPRLGTITAGRGWHHGSRGLARSRFRMDRAVLASSLRNLLAKVGRVGRRGLGGVAAWRIRSASRSRASARLRSWVRWRRAVSTSTPSCVKRRPHSVSRRWRSLPAETANAPHRSEAAPQSPPC